MIPSDDRGFTLGDGLFETVLWLDGKPVLWDEHVDRLLRGCAVLDLPAPDPAQLLQAARMQADGLARAAVRLTWSAGSGGRGLDRPAAIEPRLVVTAATSTLPAGPVRLATVSVRRNDASPASRLKTLSYMDNILARREAQARGADDAVMLNMQGDVACSSVANLFWLKDGALFTPALECGVLDGVVRGRVVAGMDAREVAAPAAVLAQADAIFLTSSLIGMRWASELDGRTLRPDPGLQVQLEQVIWDERRGRR